MYVRASDVPCGLSQSKEPLIDKRAMPTSSEQKERNKIRKRAARASLSDDQRAQANERRRKQRADRTEEQKKRDSELETERKRRERAAQTDEMKALEKESRISRMRNKRAASTEDQKKQESKQRKQRRGSQKRDKMHADGIKYATIPVGTPVTQPTSATRKTASRKTGPHAKEAHVAKDATQGKTARISTYLPECDLRSLHRQIRGLDATYSLVATRANDERTLKRLRSQMSESESESDGERADDSTEGARQENNHRIKAAARK